MWRCTKKRAGSTSQLLADVLADLDQVGAALAALARLGLVAVFNAGQLRRQRLATCALTLPLGRRLAFELFLDGGQVGIDRFLEQQPLLADECLAGLAETCSPIVGQLVRERGDLEILLGQLDLHLPQFDSIPVFFELSADGVATGRTIDGNAWKKSTPEVLVKVLTPFFQQA